MALNPCRAEGFVSSASEQPGAPGGPEAPPGAAAWTAEGRTMKRPNVTFKRASFLVLLNDHTCQEPGWEVRKSQSEKQTKICRAYLITVSATQWSVVDESVIVNSHLRLGLWKNTELP